MGCYEKDDEPPSFIKYGEFVDQLIDVLACQGPCNMKLVD